MKPPASIESDEASRPTFEEDGPRRRAASATEADAMFVGSCETDDTDSPHFGQKLASTGVSAEHEGHRGDAVFTVCCLGAYASSSRLPANAAFPPSETRNAQIASARISPTKKSPRAAYQRDRSSVSGAEASSR